MRERKPIWNVLITNDNNQRDHTYNLLIKGAIKPHGKIAVKVAQVCLESQPSIRFRKKRYLRQKTVIRSSCFVKEKTTPDGVVDKIKARVIAGLIYTLDETYSAAAVFVTVAIAAHESRHAITMDVEIAYLNARMIDDKPVYMKIGPLITAIFAQLDSNFEKYKTEREL